MRKPAVYLITVIIVLFFLSSCVSTSSVSDSIEKREAQKVSVPNDKYLTIRNSYTLESLLQPVLQMSNFMMSMDYFGQFLEYNDYIFPDYLFTILAMESDTYKPGVSTVLSSTTNSDMPIFMFEKAFLFKTAIGDDWWRFNMVSGENFLILEVLVNSYGVPGKIRFEDSNSGQKFEIVPDIALDFERAEAEVPPELLKASVKDKIKRSIDESFFTIFVNPVIVGEELIDTPAGEFMTVLVQDNQSESNSTNYWLSPDVPGGILRVSTTDSTGRESHITELSKILNSSLSYFPDAEIIPYSTSSSYNQGLNPLEPGFSEGSADSPVLIYPSEEHYGSVSDEGISYYKFTNNKRVDLFIEVLGFEGYAELIYFGEDSKFEDWSTRSEGGSLNIEDYMVLPGETVYFSINDIIDEYSVGEYFTIYIDQNPILDPIGIMIKGDIYNSAVELESGNSYILSAGSYGLDYYKTTVKKGSTLLIDILKEPDFGNLIWFDIGQGSYSGMYTEWGQGSRTIRIEGLAPGTVCYYYFSSDIDLLDPLQKLELQIIER
ncbi:MAG: hypothetical protein PF693_11060 [Spirochaetia bacterium]|jgi:hypothetical protein|nr:hypothetical protein [Spirochaetia bacterium]